MAAARIAVLHPLRPSTRRLRRVAHRLVLRRGLSGTRAELSSRQTQRCYDMHPKVLRSAVLSIAKSFFGMNGSHECIISHCMLSYGALIMTRCEHASRHTRQEKKTSRRPSRHASRTSARASQHARRPIKWRHGLTRNTARMRAARRWQPMAPRARLKSDPRLGRSARTLLLAAGGDPLQAHAPHINEVSCAPGDQRRRRRQSIGRAQLHRPCAEHAPETQAARKGKAVGQWRGLARTIKLSFVYDFDWMRELGLGGDVPINRIKMLIATSAESGG